MMWVSQQVHFTTIGRGVSSVRISTFSKQYPPNRSAIRHFTKPAYKLGMYSFAPVLNTSIITLVMHITLSRVTGLACAYAKHLPFVSDLLWQKTLLQ